MTRLNAIDAEEIKRVAWKHLHDRVNMTSSGIVPHAMLVVIVVGQHTKLDELAVT